ncbi:hypothetical protein TNCV_2549101 [Trichonephila clavipes]|nr:hypothetical protein TNCV_2549101 [Trichonephila clavipes]
MPPVKKTAIDSTAQPRLQWCHARATWTTEWCQVMYSDKSVMFLMSNYSHLYDIGTNVVKKTNQIASVECPKGRQCGFIV